MKISLFSTVASVKYPPSSRPGLDSGQMRPCSTSDVRSVCS